MDQAGSVRRICAKSIDSSEGRHFTDQTKFPMHSHFIVTK